jgi:hypothetical protein
MPTPPLIKFPSPPLGQNMEGIPLVELKQHLIVYVPKPPGPNTCRRVLDTYFDRFGDPFVDYAGTWIPQQRMPWDRNVRAQFLDSELPQLRQGPIWGYSFWDGKKSESRMLMFHGFRPASEPGLASFLRFEFEWQIDSHQIRDFAMEILGFVDCVSGYGGYFFSSLPQGEGAAESWNQVFAWAKRYWGVEVEDIDVSAASMLNGFKCVSWLTALGPSITAKNPESRDKAIEVATWVGMAAGGTLLQAGSKPVLGDRHRQEDLSIYERLATALEPLQVNNHGSFGDAYICKWDEDETQAWLRRFTNPRGFNASR